MQLLPQEIRQLLVQLHRIVVVLIRIDIFGDRDHGAGRPGQLLAEDVEVHDVESGRLIPHFNHVLLEVGERVGHGLREIDLVFVLIELVDEAQSEVVLEALPRIRVVIEEHVVRVHALRVRRRLLGRL